MHLVGFIIKKFVTMHGHMNAAVDVESENKRSTSVTGCPRTVAALQIPFSIKQKGDTRWRS